MILVLGVKTTSDLLLTQSRFTRHDKSQVQTSFIVNVMLDNWNCNIEIGKIWGKGKIIRKLNCFTDSRPSYAAVHFFILFTNLNIATSSSIFWILFGQGLVVGWHNVVLNCYKHLKIQEQIGSYKIRYHYNLWPWRAGSLVFLMLARTRSLKKLASRSIVLCTST